MHQYMRASITSRRPEMEEAVTTRLAGQLAVSLRDSGQRDRVVADAAAGPGDLTTVRLGASFATSVRTANTAVHAAKGLPGDVSLLQVRSAHPDMLPALRCGAVPVVAATPTDDAPTSLIGYDPAGRTVRIAAAHVPQRPVLLVEVDTAKAMPLGIEVVRQRLERRHHLHAEPTAGALQPPVLRCEVAVGGWPPRTPYRNG
ncbi:DUF3103 family protein [Dactylosporangium sp. NPDC050688]|uniref:DUF3103 family protein n=1 Tax=Dactylosporangium sp. NPDC050688 TaxID=3157217 RepID=UPI0033DD0C16